MTESRTNDYVRQSGTGSTLAVEANPGARRTMIVGVNPWRGTLQIKIAAEPVEGAANEELIRFLAEKLCLKRTDIHLVKGMRSSSKLLFVPLPAERVRTLLGGK